MYKEKYLLIAFISILTTNDILAGKQKWTILIRKEFSCVLFSNSTVTDASNGSSAVTDQN